MRYKFHVLRFDEWKVGLPKKDHMDGSWAIDLGYISIWWTRA